MSRVRIPGVALAVALTVTLGAPALAQDGNIYRTTLDFGSSGSLDACLTFSETAPGAMTVVDEEGDRSTAIWGHWLKKQKWFLATSDERGNYFAVTGKKVGAKKIKGDLIIQSGADIEQGTFVGRLDPNCDVTRRR